jgi:hypothetical protein
LTRFRWEHAAISIPPPHPLTAIRLAYWDKKNKKIKIKKEVTMKFWRES